MERDQLTGVDQSSSAAAPALRNGKMRRTKLFFTLVIPFIFSGCYPGGPNDIEDIGLVVTHHDVAFNFQQRNTFSLPDEVIEITGQLVQGQPPVFLEDPYSHDILSYIRAGMLAYGWIEVDEAANPDVMILPSVMMDNSSWWQYDAGFWEWYFPFEGWSFEYTLYGGNVEPGSVIIQMIYPDGATAGNVPVPWAAFCNGLVEGSPSSISARINTGINKAFQHSPYLQQ